MQKGNRDGGSSDEAVGADSQPPALMRPISSGAIVVTAAAVAIVTGGLLWFLVGVATTPSASPAPEAQPEPDAAVVIDAVRTALTAGAGTGGAAALLLAFRRQRHSEHAALEARYAAERTERDRARDLEQREAAARRDHERQVQAAAETAQDARERRITELYARAVDQLGSQQAPVRLGGLYALERLAQSSKDQRQTIVNVLCAYLRMPYTLPREQDTYSGQGVSSDNSGQGVSSDNDESAPEERAGRAREEREVRLTAQRILATHLAPGTETDPSVTFWGELDLDLTGAVLLDLDFSRCLLGSAQFDGATFTGDAWFSDTRFIDEPSFDRADFNGDAWFRRARFGGGTRFNNASFGGVASFVGSTFSGDAQYDRVNFGGQARFGSAIFHGLAGFNETTFGGGHFEGRPSQLPVRRPPPKVGGRDRAADFGDAIFVGNVEFRRACFNCGSAELSAARYNGKVALNGARAADHANHRWPKEWALDGLRDDDGYQQLILTGAVEGAP